MVSPTLMELVAGVQCLLQGSVMVWCMEVEDVHTGGLETGQTVIHLFSNTWTGQWLPIKWIYFGGYNSLDSVNGKRRRKRQKVVYCKNNNIMLWSKLHHLAWLSLFHVPPKNLLRLAITVPKKGPLITIVFESNTLFFHARNIPHSSSPLCASTPHVCTSHTQ